MSVIAKFPRDGDPGARQDQEESTLSAMDRRVRRSPLTPSRIIGVAVFLLAIGVGGFGYVRYGLERRLTVASERVTVSDVRSAPFADYAPVTGSVVPEDTVYLDITESGQVTEVLAEEGAMVEAGAPLARLKNTRLELEVLGNEAQLTEQQNNLANAQIAYEQSILRHRRDVMTVQFEITRLNDLLDRRRPLLGGVVTQFDIDDLERQLANQHELLGVIEQAQAAERELSERNLAQLQRAIDRMVARLGLVQETLGNLSLTAPIAGQLTIFDLNVGEVVGAGQRIGQIDTVGAFKITALVDEFYLNRIVIGQSASVEIAGRAYDLEVSKVSANVRDRQFEVDLAFVDREPPNLRRGQTVRPRIELGETADSLVLPNGPYYDETGGLWVLVLSPDGASASRRDVTLGRRNPELVEVLSGLSEGDRVITSSYQSYRDVERIDFD